MATQTKRNYKGKDVEMLTASGTIIGHAIDNKTFLVTKRATWADPFFPNLKTRIDKAFQDFLGVDSAKEMRLATIFLHNLQKTALPLLAEFKVQINSDFNNPARTEILTRLGFVAHHKAAQRGDQEALIELLFQFKQNMDATLQADIVAKGTDANTITTISNLAQQVKDSDISQEALKGGRKVISAAGVNEFNSIYSDVISIAKITAKFLITDKPKAQLFSYAKTVKAQNAPPKPTKTP